MWKAKKIELIKNNARFDKNNSLFFEDCYTLSINETWITNTLKNPQVWKYITNFQNNVCDFCGETGCNPGGMLMVRKHMDSILFLPAFDLMEIFEEYDSSDSDGDVECPPHEWFVNGILIVE
jgi:hypothetical protein